MHRWNALKGITVLSIAALSGLAWLPHASNRAAAAAPLALATTLIQDPHASGGGDMQQDNVYGFSNFVCTDGLAVGIDYQSLGDLNNDAAHQGHSLELRSIQDYNSTANTDPNAPSTNLAITKGTTVQSGGSTTADVGASSWTFASADTNDSGTWQGNTYIAHYAPVQVGDEVVGTIVRRDHGFVLNEDDDRSGGPAAHPNENGDDSFNLDGLVSTVPERYQGWMGADDGFTPPNDPPENPNPDGDWTPNTDGSSFDDIIRTDQTPPTYDPTDPNSSPSYLVFPDPANSAVEDCVVEQQAPHTEPRFCDTTTPTLDAAGNPDCVTAPTPNGHNGWYTHTVYVPFVHHLVYYPTTSLTTNYSFTQNGGATPVSGSVAGSNFLTLSDGAYSNLQYSSVDNFGDTETAQTLSSAVKVDATPPVLGCSATPTFSLGQSPAEVTASARDATSGMLNGATSVSAPATTTQPGAFSASLSGEDVAGNSSSVSCPYTVQYAIHLLYKAPMNAKSGSSIPVKLELTDASGTNLSSPSVGLQALCVAPAGAADCSHAVATQTGPFTYLTGLAPGGGYQFNVKSTGLPQGTYVLLFRATGESTGTFHGEAGATFTISK